MRNFSLLVGSTLLSVLAESPLAAANTLGVSTDTSATATQPNFQQIIPRVVVVESQDGNCTGVIFNKTKVLSAGHCADEKEVVSIRVFPNTAQEKRFDASVQWRRKDKAVDLAILALSSSLDENQFPPLTIRSPSGLRDLGAHFWVPNYSGGPDRGQPGLPNATPALAEVIYLGGRFGLDKSSIQRLEYSTLLGEDLSGGSSGAPVFYYENGSWFLVAINDGFFSGTKNAYGSTAALAADLLNVPLVTPQPTAYEQLPTSTIRVSEGDCISASADGFLLDSACKDFALLWIEFTNLPKDGEYSLEVTDKDGNLLGHATYHIKGEPGVFKRNIKLGDALLLLTNTEVFATIRRVDQPEILDQIGPIQLTQTITVSDLQWVDSNGKFEPKFHVLAPAYYGKVSITVADGDTVLGTFQFNLNSTDFPLTLRGLDPSKIPNTGADLWLSLDGKGIVRRAFLKPPCLDSFCSGSVPNDH